MSQSRVTVTDVNEFTQRELPFSRGFGVSCEAVSHGEARGRWAFDPRWTRPVDYVSGPVMMALADACAYWALFTVAGIVPMALTTTLSIHFLRPARGCGLTGCGKIIKLGRRISYATVDLWADDASAKLVAQASVSLAMPDAPASDSRTAGA